MYKLSKKDAGKVIFFNNGIMVVPSVYESVNPFNGVDMSDSTRAEEDRLEEFIEEFNEQYSSKAELVTFRGLEAIHVDTLLDDPEPEEEEEDISPIKDIDDSIFDEE